MYCGILKEFPCNRIQYQKNLKGVFNQEKIINQKIQNPLYDVIENDRKWVDDKRVLIHILN